MAITEMPRQTARTRTGLFTRFDRDCGLLVYSPVAASIFAIAPQYAEATWSALRSKHTGTLPWQIADALDLAHDEPSIRETTSNLLPTHREWADSPSVSRPILINWLITGECPLRCVYCYAEDLMRGRVGQPTADALRDAAERIEQLSPVVVVLSGGDPLFGPNFFRALPLLSGKVGLMLDTSGYTLTAKHIAMLKEHDVVVRLSIDSVFPRVQGVQRPLDDVLTRSRVTRRSSLDAALDALDRLLNAGITVAVQSVATKQNLPDLPALGEHLMQLGVAHWRVLKVAYAQPNREVFWKLVGGVPGAPPDFLASRPKSPFGYTFAKLMLLSQTRWRGRMTVQVTDNERVNAVVLVGPDGLFYTESTIRAEKVLIDRERPKLPRMSRLAASVDWHAHAARYLNTTSLRYAGESGV